jgi:hypothetical protein
VSIAPQIAPSSRTQERNWLPLAIAAAVVIAVAAVVIFTMERGKPTPIVTPVSATPDPYAATLPLTRLEMSESANLAGGKVTYLDGHVANTGSRTVTAVTVQILFRNMAREVAQNETQPLKLIRIRQPYVDLQPVSAAPLKPGDERDFRLIFDSVSPDWDGALPDLRIVRVDAK